MKLPVTLRSVLLAILLVSTFGIARADTDPAQNILHILDYVGADYAHAVADGNVKDAAEYQEQIEFSEQVIVLLNAMPAASVKAALHEDARALAEAIHDLAPHERITSLTSRMRTTLIDAYDVAVAPRTAPDLSKAAQLFESHCAACHGVSGHGDGPQAATLTPRPTDFHDGAWHAQRSVYGLYNTISLGVEGTSMTAFGTLSDAQRWTLAFYVANLASDPNERETGAVLWAQGSGRDWFPGLREVTFSSPADMRAAYGAGAAQVLAYLRSDPGVTTADAESPLQFSATKLEESLAAYRAGDRQNAHQLAVTSYLEGFELAESGLTAVDAALRTTVETEMTTYRSLLKRGADIGAVEAQAAKVQELLAHAREVLDHTTLSPTMALSSAFVILLREGLEAILVLAAIGAFLIKTGRRDALPYLHIGWISALALGGFTWVLASQVITISGSSRELTEGITALVAAAMLLYVGYWLHTRVHAHRWKQFIETQVSGALGGRTLWAMALISFLAVYREVFETVLFYQTLWIQAGPAGHGSVLYGLVAAAALLLALAWAIFRFSVRLPLRLFFGINSALLVILAIVFAGKGIAALQEAGKLPVNPIAFPRVDILGIYPNLEGLTVQAILALAVLGWLAYSRLGGRQQPVAG